MTNEERTTIPNAGPEPGTEHEQRKDPASGQRVGPPGPGQRDDEAVAKATEQLERAGGGH